VAVRILRAADRTAAPWKNGGGVTREVASWPEDAGLGPFSAFPGIDRVITVVDGGGMELTVDGVTHPVPERLRPFAFSGDAETHCRLPHGAITDLNVMTRRGRVSGGVEIVRTPLTLPAVAGRTVLLLVLEGRMRLGDTLLDRHDAAVTRGTDSAQETSVVCEDGTGVAALVTLDDITGP